MSNNIKPLLDLTNDQLSKFANLEDFWQQFNTVFGTQYDRTVAVDLRSQSQTSDFSQLPEVEILGNANGADASNSYKIDLSASLLTTTTPEISTVLLKDEIPTTPIGTTPQEATSVASGDYRIDSLLGGYKWGVTTISYSFYSGGSYYGSEAGLASVSEAVKNNVRTILANFISPLINLNFVEVADSASSYGQIRYLLSTDPSYAYAYYPSSTDTNQGNANDVAGDVFFNSSYDNTLDTNGIQGGPGTHGYQTIIHETLHALGLKHPGNYNGSGVGDPPYLPSGEENWDNTLMTYNFYSGAEPSTPMAYDVLALQYLYGAKSYNSGNTTYTFTYTDLYSDGVQTVGSSTLDNKITIWDSGGTDTLNFAGLGFNATGYRFDLNAGGWLSTQTAFNGTGYNVIPGPPVSFTSGTSYYATTNGTRLAYGVSIENLVNSSSNDYIIANSAANVFSGYGFATATGNDTIEGANNLDILDLSAFTSASVTQTQSGNNLVLGLGSGRSVTVKDYYLVAAGSRINIQFSSSNTLSIAKTTDGSETGPASSVFTLTRTGDLTAALNVSYSLGGTATSGSDYTDSGAGTATFAAGAATATITLPTIDDAVVDPNETIIATITTPTGYTISGSNTATATIADNDIPPSITLAVSPTSVAEDGIPDLVYTFTRTGSTTSALTVNFAVAGSATFNTDYTQTGAASYTSTTGTITFAAGSSTATLTVNPTADTVLESDETVSLSLVSNAAYTIGTTSAVIGTITNDELVTYTTFSNSAAISILDATAGSPYPSTINVSGVSGNLANLKVTLTNISHTWPDDIDILLVGPTGAKAILMSDVGGSNDLNNVTLVFDPLATAALSDSLQLTSGTYQPTNFGTGDTFNSPAPSGPYDANFSIFNNTNPNGNWSLYVIDDQSDDVGTIAGGWSLSIGTLTPNITLAVSPKNVLEDGVPNLVYTFTRTGDTTNALSVNYIVGGTATFNTDYTQTGGQISTSAFTTPRGTITFAAGANTANLTINPTADTTIESNETVSLKLARGFGYDIGTTTAVVGTITNDDFPSITLAVAPSSVTEDGATNLVYTFTRTGITTSALSVSYKVGGTATFNTDYTQTGAAAFSRTGGKITFAAGSATAILTIDPTADSIIESDESVALTLAPASNYIIGTTTSVTGTITNAVTPAPSINSLNSVLSDGLFTSVLGADSISLFEAGQELTDPAVVTDDGFVNANNTPIVFNQGTGSVFYNQDSSIFGEVGVFELARLGNPDITLSSRDFSLVV